MSVLNPPCCAVSTAAMMLEADASVPLCTQSARTSEDEGRANRELQASATIVRVRVKLIAVRLKPDTTYRLRLGRGGAARAAEARCLRRLPRGRNRAPCGG